MHAGNSIDVIIIYIYIYALYISGSLTSYNFCLVNYEIDSFHLILLLIITGHLKYSFVME